MMWRLLALVASAAPAARGEDIDPEIYSKVFEVNEMAWHIIANEVTQLKMPEGSRLLDIGAGPGEPSTTIAKQNPGLKVMVTDKQEAMLEKAKKRTAGLKNIEGFKAVSMDDLSAFEDNSFDALTAMYVLMFVDDVDKAMKEAARVLKDDGTGFFAIWKRLPFYTVAREAIVEAYVEHGGSADDLPPFPINPLALSHEYDDEYNTKGAIEEHIRGSGLTITSKHDMSYDFHFGSLEENCQATKVLTASLWAKMALDTGVDKATIEKWYCEALTKKMKQHPSWHRLDGSWFLGHGTATIYNLKKAKKDEL